MKSLALALGSLLLETRFVDNNAYIKELKYCIQYVTMNASSHCSCFPLVLILKRQFKYGGFCSR